MMRNLKLFCPPNLSVSGVSKYTKKTQKQKSVTEQGRHRHTKKETKKKKKPKKNNNNNNNKLAQPLRFKSKRLSMSQTDQPGNTE
jgi:hypothetical protein